MTSKPKRKPRAATKQPEKWVPKVVDIVYRASAGPLSMDWHVHKPGDVRVTGYYVMDVYEDVGKLLLGYSMRDSFGVHLLGWCRRTPEEAYESYVEWLIEGQKVAKASAEAKVDEAECRIAELGAMKQPPKDLKPMVAPRYE